MPAPFSRVVRGSEQPKKSGAKDNDQNGRESPFHVLLLTSVRSLFCRTLCRLPLCGIDFDAVRMQFLSNRNDGFSNALVRIGPAVLFDPFLQLVYCDRPDHIIGVHYIEIVRGEKPRYPMLYYLVGDFVLLRV